MAKEISEEPEAVAKTILGRVTDGLVDLPEVTALGPEVLRGIAYLVKSRPVRWFARREWWVEASRVHRGIGAGVVEVEMWRLQAKNVDPQAASESSGGQFELIHSADDNVWRLVHVWQ